MAYNLYHATVDTVMLIVTQHIYVQTLSLDNVKLTIMWLIETLLV